MQVSCTRNLHQKFDASFSCEFLVQVSRTSFLYVCLGHKTDAIHMGSLAYSRVYRHFVYLNIRNVRYSAYWKHGCCGPGGCHYSKHRCSERCCCERCYSERHCSIYRDFCRMSCFQGYPTQTWCSILVVSCKYLICSEDMYNLWKIMGVSIEILELFRFTHGWSYHLRTNIPHGRMGCQNALYAIGFNFGGPFLIPKFPLYMVFGTDLKIFVLRIYCALVRTCMFESEQLQMFEARPH